jgi:hypothetical protein
MWTMELLPEKRLEVVLHIRNIEETTFQVQTITGLKDIKE